MTTNINFVRPIAVAFLIGTVAATAVQLLRTFIPGWNGSYVVVMCVMAGLEGLYSPRLLRAQNVHGTDTFKFHVIELLVLIVVLKLIGSVGSIVRIPSDLLTIDLRTAASICLMAVCWFSGLDSGHDFVDLDSLPSPEFVSHDYVPPAQRLGQRFFLGGVIVLTTAGVLNLRNMPVSGAVPNVLIYFLAGLVLMSQVRLHASRREWQSLGLTPSEEVMRPWVRSAAILIGLAALVAFVLPTRYMLGLLDVLRDLFSLITSVIVFIFSLIGWLILLPFRLLLGQSINSPIQPTPAVPPLALPPAAPGSDALLSLLPKLILLVVIGYIVYTYLRDNPEAWALLKNMQTVRLLRQLWAALWRQLTDFSAALNAELPRRLPRWARRPGFNIPQPFGFVRLNALSPRDRIRYFYLSTLRRARDQGIPRAPDQTPYEYEDVLDSNVPDAEAEIAALTEAFVEARYSEHPVDADSADSVQAQWEMLRHTLQQTKRQKKTAETISVNNE